MSRGSKPDLRNWLAVDHNGSILVLAFRFEKDRYRHAILCSRGRSEHGSESRSGEPNRDDLDPHDWLSSETMNIGGLTVVAISVEGDEKDGFPPSPPLQSLSIEEVHGNRVALLVGQAGVGHWSASIESNQRDMFVFDIAARTDSAVARLGSEYQIRTDLLECVALGDDGANRISASNHGTSSPWGMVRIAPSHFGAQPHPTRWRYGLKRRDVSP